MRALLATMRAAMAEAAGNRRALVVQMTVMIVNDAAWIVFWALFFHRTGTVHGWNLHGMILLQAVLTTAGGLTLGVLANARSLAHLALDGRLDSMLTLPVRPLAHLLVRRIEPTNLGDTVFGVVLFVAADHPTLARTVVFVAVVITSTVLITSFLVLTGSLSFFAGRSDGGEMGFHALLLISAYPTDMFGGAAKLAIYTVIPAAFVASVPAKVLDHFHLSTFVAIAGIAAVFAAAANTTFHAGLRRYTSGSVWTRA